MTAHDAEGTGRVTRMDSEFIHSIDPGIDLESKLPLYYQVKLYLKRLIEKWDLQSGDQLPPEIQLTQTLGVSRNTVREAVREMVHEGMVYRVQGKGTFVAPSPQRDTVTNVGSSLLGLCLSLNMTGDHSLKLILSGIHAAAREHRFRLLLSDSHNDAEFERSLLVEMIEAGVDGLMLLPVNGHSVAPYVAKLCKDLPIVVMDRYFPKIPTDVVATNNLLAADMAVKHLVELGHREICYITTGCFDHTSVRDRLRGYRQALLSAGIHPSKSDICIMWKQSFSDSVRVLREFIGNRRPEAVVSMNEQTTLQLLEAAALEGVDVPADLALVGIDDIAGEGRLRPRLTAVVQSFEAMGSMGVRMLADRIEKGLDCGPRRSFLTPRLIVRESCGVGSTSRTRANIG